jgi:hypothetical protein
MLKRASWIAEANLAISGIVRFALTGLAALIGKSLYAIGAALMVESRHSIMPTIPGKERPCVTKKTFVANDRYDNHLKFDGSLNDGETKVNTKTENEGATASSRFPASRGSKRSCSRPTAPATK